MSYVEGFIVAVPAANKEAYLKQAAEAAAMFKEFGATRVVECWGDDVPDGKVTDFRRAVQAKEGEVVVLSWIEYPSKAARDAASAKFMSDPRKEDMGKAMAFDGKRMIYGGFAKILDEGKGGRMGYADGGLVPVPHANKEAFRTTIAKMADVLREHGATRIVDAWSDDVPDGTVTDFKRAVKATGEEAVVYSWIEWPSKQMRDAGWPKVMADPRLHPDKLPMPFDGQRWVHGGFQPILDV